jgi:hypothetical protein
MVEGVNSTIIFCKNFYKCYNVPPQWNNDMAKMISPTNRDFFTSSYSICVPFSPFFFMFFLIILCLGLLTLC